MDLSKIKPGEPPEYINTIIEIPFQSNVKYEIDKESGLTFVDRVLGIPVHYPCNYGFVPNTLSEDGDPIDVCIISRYPIIPGAVVKCKVIGVLHMEDERGKDEKIIAVPHGDLDATYKGYNSIEDVSKATMNKLKIFFKIYKEYDDERWTKVGDFDSVEVATRLIKESIDRFHQ